jgi:hypothetical protein
MQKNQTRAHVPLTCGVKTQNRQLMLLGAADAAGEPTLNVLWQPALACELRCLRAFGGPLCFPPGDRRAVPLLAAARGGIAAQFARDHSKSPQGHGPSRAHPCSPP